MPVEILDDGRKRIRAPLSDDDVQQLEAGDVVLVSGVIYAARDAAHKLARLDTNFSPWDPRGISRMKGSKPTRAACVALIAAVALGTQIGCSSMKSAAKTAVGGAEGADPATTVYQLPNGMRVLMREDHFAPVAALQVWVGAGGADENEIEAGVAHVHEHMLFKGTSNRGVGEIAAEIESSGGRINAWTSWNETVYHIVVASRYADTGLEVLADAVRNSSFDPKELDKELGVVLEEWKRGEDSPSRRVFESLFDTAFTVHPYRRPVIGTKESIEGLTRERVLSFFGRFYAPNNMTLVIVGDIDTEHMKAVVDKAFGDFAAHEIPRPARPAEPQQTALRFQTDRMDVRESQLALGFHVPGATHPDAPLLDMLSFVMGGGESSRLYKKLVAQSELATSIGAFAYTPPDPGLCDPAARRTHRSDGGVTVAQRVAKRTGQRRQRRIDRKSSWHLPPIGQQLGAGADR